MTKEEAIKLLKEVKFHCSLEQGYAVDMAISALSTIEDIKAEIKDYRGFNVIGIDAVAKEDIIEIIDKYIKENKQW